MPSTRDYLLYFFYVFLLIATMCVVTICVLVGAYSLLGWTGIVIVAGFLALLLVVYGFLTGVIRIEF